MKAEKRKNGRWFARARVELNGKRVRIFATPATYGLPNTKSGAEEAIRRKLNTLYTGKSTPSSKGVSPTLRSFVDTFLANSDSHNKGSAYDTDRSLINTHILPAFGPLRLSDISFARIDDFKQSLLRVNEETGKAKAKPKSVNNILSVLRRILVYGKKRGELAEVPEFVWMKVDRPAFKFLDFEQATALLAAADDDWRTIILVALRTGMRIGELHGLQWTDINFATGWVRVSRNRVNKRFVTPKNRKSRDIPLSQQVLTALAAHKELAIKRAALDPGAALAQDALVFVDANGHALNRTECKWPLWRACGRVGLPHYGWHVLRHTFASHLAMRGVSIQKIQELMGHATVAMTLRYAHLTPDVKREAVDLLDGTQSDPNTTQTHHTLPYPKE